MMNMKKLASLLLALTMILTMTTAFAENAATELGSITINGVGASSTYEIYRLLDLESYDTESGAYSYKVNSDWTAFFATNDAKAYFTIDDNGYATWIATEDDATVAAFAKKALAYAKEKGIDPVRSTENNDMTITGTTGKFSDLSLGYYLVDSSVGALCGLTTTNPNASINAKNGAPIIYKQVVEDSTNNYGEENSADIGQTVYYRTTINVHAGAENYVLHDKMSDGLTFEKVTKIEVVDPSVTDGTGTTELVEGTDYTVVLNPVDAEDPDHKCTFHVVFTKDACDKLEMNDKILVYYSAMLNRNAVIAGDGNTNEAKLEFGEDNFTTTDSTTTKTYGFDLIKTDSQNKLIDGAAFRIYDAQTEGKEVAVVLMDDGVTYRRARADETGIDIVVKDGQVRVVGFDNGTYYLEEVVTPAGYNQLSARQRFIISDGNLDATFNDGIFSTGSGVHVVNKSGTMLPETGGIGTTLFYVFGGMMAVAAVVLLVTKKRMSNMA